MKPRRLPTALKYLWIACFAGLSWALLTGCNTGPARSNIMGTVTIDGAPVKGGTVTFKFAEGTPVQGPISPAGGFALKNAPVGEAKVGVETTSVKQVKKEGSKSPIPPGEKAAETEFVPIPTKYANPETSGLTFTINPGDNNIEIKLSKAG